jgi:AcrR family transcriptional regulator
VAGHPVKHTQGYFDLRPGFLALSFPGTDLRRRRRCADGIEDGAKTSVALATHLLEMALTVFARHGFRKTSTEDIAKAAGISRQGIYLHFKNKDEIFGASIQKALDDGLQAANRILDDDRLTVEEKLLRALDEWFGHVGLLGPEASDLMVQCERVLGDAVGKSRSSFQKKLEKVILARSARKTKGTDKRAATIADMLCACGMTWKHSFSSGKNS